ncbi:hypothetical protein GF351_00765 [Candidatus Woesearchaeota archaeon]|nr:hypothetical protein [Candidatus Woesearchaeota archaeon]
MDIQEMKKVNELSKELQKHGIADSSEDSAVIAEKMVNKEGSVLPEGSEKADRVQQVEVVLDRVTRNMKNEIAGIREQVAGISSQIDSIKAEIRSMSKTPVCTPGRQEKESQDQPKEQDKGSQEVQSELKTEKDEGNPRQGAYKPEDVAVDKIFYYGQK